MTGAAPGASLVSISTGAVLLIDGVVTVWAAGNDGGDGSASMTNPPGQDPTGGILSVASYFDQGTGTRDGSVSEFSSRGLATDPSTWPDLSAPGEDIESACRPYLVICSTGMAPNNGPGPLDIGTFNTISGTSMAAPHIAGIVAQLFQADPTATPAEIEAALKSTTYHYTDGSPYTSVGGYSTSFDKGTGLVDVVAAVAALT
ncbi:MAG TPA: S8 family serine peptidase [Ilumatobacteraceae bacterium]|nr:S8 family serine peptidase [Ilumatobacteraceae bacterium]